MKNVLLEGKKKSIERFAAFRTLKKKYESLEILSYIYWICIQMFENVYKTYLNDMF